MIFTLKFFIINQDVQAILGCKDSQKCGFIKVEENDIVKGNVFHVINENETINVKE